MKNRSTGRRCKTCGETIQQNEKVFTDGKGEYAHNHNQAGWKEIKSA